MRKILLAAVLGILATSVMPQAQAHSVTLTNQSISVGGGDLAVELRSTIKRPPQPADLGQPGDPFPPIPYPTIPYPPQPSQIPLQCGTSNPLNGIDQRWYSVSGHAGSTAVVTPTGTNEFLQDLDAYFFDSSCNFIDNDGAMGNGEDVNEIPNVGATPKSIPFTQYGDPESGVVPGNAAWMVVVLWSGGAATFTVSY